MAKRGLYANIHAKKKRIAAGSGEKMRTSYMKDRDLKNPMYKELTEKSKKTRPNKKNRY